MPARHRCHRPHSRKQREISLGHVCAVLTSPKLREAGPLPSPSRASGEPRRRALFKAGWAIHARIDDGNRPSPPFCVRDSVGAHHHLGAEVVDPGWPAPTCGFSLAGSAPPHTLGSRAQRRPTQAIHLESLPATRRVRAAPQGGDDTRIPRVRDTGHGLANRGKNALTFVPPGKRTIIPTS